MWLCAAGVSVLAMALTAPRALRARTAAHAELAGLRLTNSHAEELMELRSRLAQGATRQTNPSGTLAERAAHVLADAGLPSSALTNLSPARVAPRDGVLHRRATLMLEAVTLPQLGRFLDAWRSHEPAWTVSCIDLSPETRSQTPPGADLPIRAVITIETIQHEGDAP
jgi:hypothetical protein